MPSKSEAIEAMKQLDGKEMKGKKLIVNEARQREERRGGGGKRHGGRGGNRSGGRGGRW